LWFNTSTKKHFKNVGVDPGCYVLRKKESDSFTSLIQTPDGVFSLDLRDVPFLPINASKTSLSIYKKAFFDIDIKNRFFVSYTRDVLNKPSIVSKHHNNTTPYPNFHTNSQTLYTSIPHKDIHKRKVIFSTTGAMRPFYDNGTQGTTNISASIEVNNEDEAETLKKYLTSKLVQFILKHTKTASTLSVNFLRGHSLPKVDLTRSWTDNELYEHFNLTEEEINLIEETIK